MQSNRLMLLLAGLVIVIAALVMFTPTSPSTDGLRAAFDAEFHTRPDGYRGLCDHYGFDFPETPRQMDVGLMYQACANKEVDVIDAFATDGRIAAYDLVVLEDDKQFFPPYYAAPVVRGDTLKEHPEIGTVLDELAGRLTDDAMRQLNYDVDESGVKPADAARSFLVKQGLLAEDATPGDGSSGTVTIGGKHFTEQEILGEIVAILLEHKTDLKVDRRLNLGGTLICFSALQAGDLDLYVEYTGTGLVNILEKEVVADPDKAYEIVKEGFAEQYDLIWLKPLGFNNTYTLTMRKAQAEELGIKTISDLAAHLGGE